MIVARYSKNVFIHLTVLRNYAGGTRGYGSAGAVGSPEGLGISRLYLGNGSQSAVAPSSDHSYTQWVQGSFVPFLVKGYDFDVSLVSYSDSAMILSIFF